MSDTLPEPLVPADVDLRDFPFMPLDVTRLLDSEIMALEDAEAFRAGVASWCKGWHQVPAASLPNEDGSLCRTLGYGRDLKTWARLRKAGALHGWVLCSDGRLYHPVVAEKALEAWLEKLNQRLSSGAGNAKRWGIEFDPQQINEQIVVARSFLSRLNPQSKALYKRKPPAIPETVPPDIPNEASLDVQDSSGQQSRPVSRRDDDQESQRDRKRQGQGHRQGEETPGIGKSKAGGNARAPARDRPPPPEDIGNGLPEAVAAVKTAVSQAFERWFDLPDRPFSHRDEELFAAWISAGIERGLTPDRAAEAIGAEVDRQFKRLAERKPDDPPRSLVAVLDADVRRAIGSTQPAWPAAPEVVVPEPWVGRIDRTTYQTWIEPVAASIVVSGDSASIVAPTRMHRDWLTGRLEHDLCACLGVRSIEVSVAEKVSA